MCKRNNNDFMKDIQLILNTFDEELRLTSMSVSRNVVVSSVQNVLVHHGGTHKPSHLFGRFSCM